MHTDVVKTASAEFQLHAYPCGKLFADDAVNETDAELKLQNAVCEAIKLTVGTAEVDTVLTDTELVQAPSMLTCNE